MKSDWVIGGLLVLLVLSSLDLFSEPYYHRTRVNFWDWAKGEIIELCTGERDI